ncbi:hypothetical protein V491_01503 [Pseudogymnoascus sp. VKM F-3775]|nr:hypothetical protein V491_01503 [Pseudogymnoascus sp. VKM F-3775]
MEPLAPQIPEAVERTIVEDTDSPMRVYKSVQSSRARIDGGGLADQKDDIPKVSAPGRLFMPQPLRKMKTLTSKFFQSHLQRAKEDTAVDSACASRTAPTQLAKIFTIKFESPWVEYEYIRQSDEVTVVRQRSSYFKLANMQEFPATNSIQQSQLLATVSHPNIASIYGVYSYIDKLLVVTEHLDISLAQLDFQSDEIEEWEIATIVAEVLKGLTYISSKNISCQDLTTTSIRLSVRGEIKLLLRMENVRYHQVENPRFAPALLEMPVLEEIIEAMTLPRYHRTSGDRWSKETLSFLYCSISGSLQNLNDHRLLLKAESPKKLIPRIRFVLELETSNSKVNNDNGPAVDDWARTPRSAPRRGRLHRRKTSRKSASRRSNEIVIKPGLKSFALVQAAEDCVSVLDSTASANGGAEGATNPNLVRILVAAEDRKMTQQRANVLNESYAGASRKAEGFWYFMNPSTLVTYFTTMKQLLVYYYRVVRCVARTR